MSRWLALVEGFAVDAHALDSKVAESDKTTDMQPDGELCQVLSNCQAQFEENEAASQRDETHQNFAIGGHSKTWTGKVVSLDAWRQLSEWEKHGPNGRHWNGITKEWEPAE